MRARAWLWWMVPVMAMASPAAAQPRATQSALPARALSAQLVSARGSVEVSAPTARPAREGEVLTQGMRVRVGDDSAAVLRFDGGVTLSLDANSQLTLFASPSPTAAGSNVTTLSRGTARVTVPAAAIADRTESLPVSTLALTAWLGRGNAVISADLGGHITRVAVHEGRVRVRAADREYLVPAGMGTLEEEGRPAAPLRALPRPPEWRSGLPERVLSWGEAVDAPVAWSQGRRQSGRYPVQSWRVELSQDQGFRDVSAVGRLAGSERRWRARGMTPGVWYARVFALDGDRFESAPSAVSRVEVAAPRVLPGSEGHRAAFEVPRGFFCAIDTAPFMPSEFPVPLEPARDHRVRCALRADGRGARERVVPAASSGPLLHDVRVTPPVVSGDGRSVRSVISVDLRDAERRPVSWAQVTATAQDGVTVESLRETEQRGVYSATLTAPSTARQVRLRFTVNGAVSFDAASGLGVAERPAVLTGTVQRAPRRVEVVRAPVFRPQDDDSALPEDE